MGCTLVQLCCVSIIGFIFFFAIPIFGQQSNLHPSNILKDAGVYFGKPATQTTVTSAPVEAKPSIKIPNKGSAESSPPNTAPGAPNPSPFSIPSQPSTNPPAFQYQPNSNFDAFSPPTSNYPQIPSFSAANTQPPEIMAWSNVWNMPPVDQWSPPPPAAAPWSPPAYSPSQTGAAGPQFHAPPPQPPAYYPPPPIYPQQPSDKMLRTEIPTLSRTTFFPPAAFLEDPTSTVGSAHVACVSGDGRSGECVPAAECYAMDGSIIDSGTCAQTFGGMTNRICCNYQSYCGYESNREVTHIRNLEYPRPSNNSDVCHLRISLLPFVCQLRLDFLDFDLRPPPKPVGKCDPENRLQITSTSREAFIPLQDVCGTLNYDPEISGDNNHLYIHLHDKSQDVYTVNSNPESVDFKFFVKNFPSRWNVRISQVPCDGSPLLAPSGCAHYYSRSEGNITSFNVQDKAYQANINTAHCIARQNKACGIRYSLRNFRVDVGAGGNGMNQQLRYGLDCKDYLAFNGQKNGICGSLSSPKMLSLPATGPQGFTFRTDREGLSKGGDGFSLSYKYLQDCTGVQFDAL